MNNKHIPYLGRTPKNHNLKSNKQMPKCSPVRKKLSPRKTINTHKCFIDFHQAAGVEPFIVPSGGPAQTYFEDTTCNHNKTLFQLRHNGLAGNVEVAIRTRGCDKPITILLEPGRTRVFQVEDFECLMLLNLGTAPAPINYNIQKTFCICCVEDNLKHPVNSQKFNQYSHNSDCFSSMHQASITSDINQLPINTDVTLFEDFTCNHNKALLDFTNGNTVTTLMFKVFTKGCFDPLIITVSPAISIGDSTVPGRRFIQVEDLERVSILIPAIVATGSFTLSVQKSFCICCNSEGNNQKCDSCCNRCNGCRSKEEYHICNLRKRCSCFS